MIAARYFPVLALTLAACTPALESEVSRDLPSGKVLYTQSCSGCHGASGRGDGPMAADLTRTPADLTTLAADWQEYPQTHVMGYVDGYFRDGTAGEVMPAFGSGMADGPLVPFDAGDGVMSPTPQALIRIADYVETLQVR
ncbi:Cytochrome c [Rhodobacteraceae bacterium THAF1]|uniref:c-type cytochrome n=1 Tax=Palleronia sp. THAF1 TaxID=2587842 RepID=UPI000F3F3024|nr:cytochrome c [Palleronia sp. THAF1]QFU09299.1 Cytochrome c [Palleronia sp. THAF1]VDC26676.1 Cytochrome c [Rhodobacteraceae bacterium THAF1]